MVKVKNHQSVDWEAYFFKIKEVCPWSYMAWHKQKIDIVRTKNVIPLDTYRARIYVFPNLTRRRLKKLCRQRDHGEYEWLWSTPSYGAMATPVACLIQQNRQELNQIRSKINAHT